MLMFFFGVNNQGVKYTASVCLSIVSKLLGIPSEDSKDADHQILMVVLGVEATIDWPRRAIRKRVDKAKADRWCGLLQQVLDTCTCDPEIAEKHAGREEWRNAERNAG